MIIFIAIPVLLQIFCIIHLIRNNRERSWFFLIIFIPIAASIAYIFVEIILPFLKNPKAKEISKSVFQNVNKDNNLKRLQEQFKFSAAIENEVDDAVEEFRIYIESYSDLESICRYALFLKNYGRIKEF
jgi:hypothetical protein